MRHPNWVTIPRRRGRIICEANQRAGGRELASVAADMAESAERQFHTGQAVWVIEPDGSQRPGEYLGEGQESRSLSGPPRALIIFIDAPGLEVVEVERLRVRKGKQRGARLAVEAGAAAATRAEQARERGQTAGRRAAELHEEGLLPRHRDREAGERALTAADAARAAEASAAQALDRAAEAHDRAARAHEHAAEVAERRGEGSAPRHRRAAQKAHEAARRDRAAAVDARHRSQTTPFGEHR